MNNKFAGLGQLLGLLLFFNVSVLAQDVPTVMNYQGRLLLQAGQAPVDDMVDIEFSIWDGPETDLGATRLWSETWLNVDVTNGIFSVLLGSNGTPLDPADFQSDSTLFLQLVIEGETLAPRQQLGTSAFAMVDEPSNEFQDLSEVLAVGGDGGGQSISNVAGVAAIGGDVETDQQLVSTVGQGTAPLQVASTTRIDNLNADLLDGLDLADLARLFGFGERLIVTETVAATGNSTAIAIGADGLPLVAHRNGTGGVSVLRCFDIACDSNASEEIDTRTALDDGLSIAIGTDGFPVLAYTLDGVGLVFAKCSNGSCSNRTLSTLETDGGVNAGFTFASMVIGSDGFPVMAYQEESSGDLIVRHCSDANCIASSPESTSDVGSGPKGIDMTIGSDGNPLIAYMTAPPEIARIAHCNDIACSSDTTTTLLMSAMDSVEAAVTVGTDGNGLVSFFDGNVGELLATQCTNIACTTFTPLTSIDADDPVTHGIDIALRTDGLGLIVYHARDNQNLDFVRCSNAACSAFTTRNIESSGVVGRGPSVAIGADGLPIISYIDKGSDELKVFHCGNADCSP